MPMARLSRGMLSAIVAGQMGVIHKIVSLNGFKYGSLGEVPGAPGISSSSPRTAATDTLIAQAMDWRGLKGFPPQLTKAGKVQTSLDQGQSFDFEWRPLVNTEDVVGGLPQIDLTYGRVIANEPTTCDHGYVVDSCGVSANGTSGFTQKVTPGGSLLGRTFTFSVHAAVPTPIARAFAQNIRLSVGTSADPPASQAEVTTLNTSYAAGRTTYLRASVTRTFTTSNTEIQVVGAAAQFGGLTIPLLFAAAQLDEAASPSAYERTGAAKGVRNLLLNSHFPTRAPWTTRVASGSVTIVPDAGRGPEIRAIVPTPGTIEFGIGVTGINVSNGLCQLTPYDAYGQIANKLVSGGAATTWGVYRTVAQDPKGKTAIVSAFVRNTGSNIAQDISLQLCPMNGGTQLGAASSSVGLPPKTYRRVWWTRYIDGSVFPTANGIQAFVFCNNTTAGKELEVTGLQIELVAGNSPQPPADYEHVGSGTGAVNLFQFTEDLSNGYWSRQNLASVTNGSGYGPIEYYDVTHPDFGKCASRLRINPGGLQVLANDWHAGTAGDKGDFSGEAYSIGAYGTEVMGATGDMAWSGGTLTGWTLTGGASNFVETDGAPQAFVDDEEPTTPQGVHHFGDGAAARYQSATLTLPVGWATVRLRVARNAGGNGAKLALLNPGGNYAGFDRVSWPDGTIRWLRCATKNQGLNSPDFGVSVWHVYCASAGTYTLRLAGENTGTPYEVWWDQLRVWTDAGALYASTDRTETAGNCGFLTQGLNVLFRGVIDGAPTADDDRIKVQCRDYPHGTKQQIPNWTTQPNCQVKFRGLECGNVSQKNLAGVTLALTAESSPTTTHTLSAGTTDTFQALRYILGSDGVTYTKILTILNSTQFTTDTTQTYASGAPVIYADCKHIYSDCYLRSRTHRYSGCRATQALIAQGGSPLWTTVLGHMAGYRWLGPQMQLATNAQLMGAISINAQQALNDKRVFDDTAIPLVYGRKTVKMIPVETHATQFAADGSEWLTTFYVGCMGEIEDVRGFFGPDGPIIHDPVNGMLVYWHPGRQGEDAWWTVTDQFGGPPPVYASGPALVQKIDNQRRDFRTNTDNTYNRLFYAVVQNKKGNAHADLNDPTNIIDLYADIKARIVQIYDKNGAPVGSPAWSRNPIWIAIDALLNGVFGPALPISLVDWATMAASAAICDAPLTSPVAVSQIRTTYPAWAASTGYLTGALVVNDSGKLFLCTTAGTSAGSGGPTGTAADITDNTAHWRYYGTFASTIWGVTSVDGFAPEMNVTVAGTARIVKFVDPINLRLTFDSAFSPATGDVIQGFPARFTCDLNITSKVDIPTFLDMVMSSCRGILTFDNGKLGILVDKSSADTTATTWNIGNPTPSTLLGVIPQSVGYNPPDNSNSYNALELTYEDAQLVAGTGRVLKFYDADRGGLDFPRPLKLEASGCDTAEQSLRAMLPRAAKMFSATGGLDPNQDARGVTVETGIAGLPIQLSDFIVVTRPNRTTSPKSRVRALTVNEDLTVSIETAPEIRAIRPEGFSAPFDPYTDTPLLGTGTGTQLPLASLALVATQSAGGQLHATVTVMGYGAAPGAGGGLNAQKFAQLQLHVSTTPGFVPTTGRIGFDGTMVASIDGASSGFIWNVPRAQQEIQLYVKAVGLQGGIDDNVIISNEIAIIVYRVDETTTDPTQRQHSSDANMVYDGDFNNGDPAASPVVGWDTEGVGPAYSANYQFPTAQVTPDTTGLTGAAYTGALGNVTDNSDATLNSGAATNVTRLRTIKYHSFGAGTHVGRPYIRGQMVGAATCGSVQYYYTLDRTVGSPVWVLWATLTPTGTIVEPTGPEVTADYTKFGIKAVSIWNRPSATITDSNYRVAFDQRNSPAYYGQVTGGKATIQGDGTNYGAVVRAFPGPSPEDQTAFTANTVNSCEIRVKKTNSGDTLDTHAAGGDVVVEIEDQATGTKWTLLTIDPADITAAWRAIRVQFSVGSNVTGNLVVRAKTKNSKPIDLDKLGVFRGDQIGSWLPSPYEMANGFYGDMSTGDIVGFNQGHWTVGSYKLSETH